MFGIILFYAVKPLFKHFIALSVLIILLLIAWQYAEPPGTAPVQAVLPFSGLSIAIDPGHGGYDPGSSGSGIVEKDLVLEIGLYLSEYLEQGGARTFLTREQDKDFLEAIAGPKKRLDFKNRLQLVEREKADLLISIHANYISSPRWHGSQVFFQEDCSEGEKLARSIQHELIRVLKNTDRQAKSGNYFMLRESSMTAVIVEVGFLSNPTEAALLGTPEYQKKMAWAIYLGILSYYHADP